MVSTIRSQNAVNDTPNHRNQRGTIVQLEVREQERLNSGVSIMNEKKNMNRELGESG